MPVVLAILRVPAALGLLLALLLTVGCGPGTARQVAVDPVPVSAHQLPSDQRTVAKVEPSKPRPTVDASTPQSLLFADDHSEHEPYRPRGPPGLTFLPMFPAPLILPLDVRMPSEVGIVVERVVRGQHVVMWAAISPVGWRVGTVRTVGFRYYNPVTGRYISRDPAGFPNGLNNYLYVNNNPINRIDPLGLWSWSGFWSGVGKAAIGVVVGVVVVAAIASGVGLVAGVVATAVGASAATASAVAAATVYVGASAYGGATVGKATYEASTGKEYWSGEHLSDEVRSERAGEAITGAFALGLSARLGRAKELPNRPASEQPTGGNGTVLRDGEGATPNETTASNGGPQGGSRSGQGAVREQRVDEATDQATGEFSGKCWRCGAQSDNPADFHLGHRTSPTSQGGNLSNENTALEGAACNLSAGNRGAPSPGMDCSTRGGPGAPFGRTSSLPGAPPSPGSPTTKPGVAVPVVPVKKEQDPSQ